MSAGGRRSALHLPGLAWLVLLLAWAVAGPAGAVVSEADRLWTVGVQAFEDGLFDVTYRELGRLVETAPADPRVGDAILLRGKSALALGWYPEALAEFQAAERHPLRAFTPGEPVFWQAEVLFRLKRYENARERYSLLLRAQPSSPYAPDALYARGFSELELGLPEEAVASFRTLLRDHPGSTLAGSAAYAAGRELVRAKRWNDAIAVLSGYATRFPQSRFVPEAQYLLGVSQVESGRRAEAIRTLEQFVGGYPKHELAPAARALLGDAHMEAGRSREAIDQYRALVRDAPTSGLAAQALYHIGELSDRLGRPQDAEAAWRTLRRDHARDPMAESAGVALASLYLKRRQFEPAMEMARQVAEAQGSQRLDALLLLGEGALKAGRTADAAAAYAAAVAEAPANSPIRFRALAGSGLAAETRKELAAAKRAYQEVVDKADDAELVQWATARIQGIEAREKAAARSAPRPKAKPQPKRAPATGRSS